MHDAYNNRTNIRLQKNDNMNAFTNYTRVIEINPNDFMGYYNRGIAHLNTPDYNTAVSIERVPS